MIIVENGKLKFIGITEEQRRAAEFFELFYDYINCGADDETAASQAYQVLEGRYDEIELKHFNHFKLYDERKVI